MKPKTNSERQAALVDRRLAIGLKQIRVWCTPAEAEQIREYAAKLARKRDKVVVLTSADARAWHKKHSNLGFP